ncbi:MAG: DUF58 domain-containing protein [Gemmatimonadales bacterium]|nr:MAG: DUF58 domain-containing protein [Gemmatimonadales bacterium]
MEVRLHHGALHRGEPLPQTGAPLRWGGGGPGSLPGPVRCLERRRTPAAPHDEHGGPVCLGRHGELPGPGRVRHPLTPVNGRDADPGGDGSPGRREGGAGGPAARSPEQVAPELLARMGPVDLVARRMVDGTLAGLHRSGRRGTSAEFAELRAYRPGDDLRHVDWRMVGRSDRFYVKEYREDTHLVSRILLDASASMGWSSRPGELPSKLWYGKLLAACLGLLLLRQGDRVGLVAFDDTLRNRVPPRGGPRQQREFLRRIREVEAGGGTLAHTALRDEATAMQRRGLVVLVSDLLVDPDPVTRILTTLARRGHDVRVIHLMDPGERTLEGGGRRRFVDPETGRSLDVSVPEIRDAYRETVSRVLEEWRRRLGAAGVSYRLCSTDRPPVEALNRVLSPGRPAGRHRGTPPRRVSP